MDSSYQKLDVRPEDAESTAQVKHALRREDFESTAQKLLIFAPFIATTVVSLGLVVSVNRNWFIQGNVYEWIEGNRAGAQTIVQVLAGLLGALQIGALRTLINYRTRRKLSVAPLELDWISFYSALSSSQANWSLPFARLAVVLIFIAAALIPSAIWAGALTPVLTITANPTSVRIAVPAYANPSSAFWESKWENADVNQTALGTFTYGAIRAKFSYFINDGVSASTADGRPTLVKKSDNSNYTYYGRSYGVGASVGLVDNIVNNSANLITYSYNETGYHSMWTCKYNQSSNSSFQPLGNSIYLVKSSSPIGPELDPGYNVGDFSGRNNILAAKSWVNTTVATTGLAEPLTHIDILGTGLYANLSKIQCAGTFRPATFRVNVDVIQRQIVAVPYAAAALDFESTGKLATMAGDTLAALSLVSTTSYASVLGDMLLGNIFNAKRQNTTETEKEKALRGVAETIQALADEHILCMSTAQLMNAGDVVYSLTTADVQVLRVGQSGFIYASAAINAAFILVLIIEAARTRLWRGLPRLNLIDTKSAIVATSFGGDSIARQYGKSKGWTGSAGDRTAGRVAIRLRRNNRGLALQSGGG